MMKYILGAINIFILKTHFHYKKRESPIFERMNYLELLNKVIKAFYHSESKPDVLGVLSWNEPTDKQVLRRSPLRGEINIYKKLFSDLVNSCLKVGLKKPSLL